MASAEDLIILKLTADRPRDTNDASRIVLGQREDLDRDYLFKTGRDFQEALGQDIVPQISLTSSTINTFLGATDSCDSVVMC